MAILIVQMVKMRTNALVKYLQHQQLHSKCFFPGCSSNEFSCNNWNTVYKRATCIPLNQRCDGIEQCPLGTDEKDCLILADSVGVEIQNVGFHSLHITVHDCLLFHRKIEFLQQLDFFIDFTKENGTLLVLVPKYGPKKFVLRRLVPILLARKLFTF